MIDVEAENHRQVERAFLVGACLQEDDRAVALEHLDELSELAASCGIGTVDRVLVPIRKMLAQYYVGAGKAEEIARLATESGADCLVFDVSLSPSQQRNWERLTHLCVVDREEIILDIFARRASTREAVLQVELAQLQYSLPRLTRAWTHLSRQKGGITGMRGEGETQIETDRRLLRRRIQQLGRELETVKKQRSTARKSRERSTIASAALVGYTNVGKSSLLRALSGAEVLVEDKLFATLDPTTRRMRFPEDGSELLLTDTVGFVRKLPHSLVAAFKSTLEEALFADFLLLVLDISSPQLDEHYRTTMEVLEELGAEKKDIQIVFNKTDKLPPERGLFVSARCRAQFPGAIFCSAATGEGMDELRRELKRRAGCRRRRYRVLLPPDRFDLRSFAASKGAILSEKYDDYGNLHLEFKMDEQFKNRFENYMI